jgi:DNA-binding transcriptional regulator YbjK
MPYWRQKPKQKDRRVAADILRDREARRTAALAACVAEISDREGREGVTHRLVAERVGVPVQYMHWRFPSIETLLAVAGD